MTKVEALVYGDRKVYTVAAFNRGVAGYVARLPEVWVEGEAHRAPPERALGASLLHAQGSPHRRMPAGLDRSRSRFDRLDLDLTDGERVHVLGRPTVYEAKGELSFRASTIERFGLGEHVAALQRLKRALAAEGLFAPERKRPLPRFPRAVGLLTGSDAAARGDLVTAISTRFPPARLVVAETRVQGRARRC